MSAHEQIQSILTDESVLIKIRSLLTLAHQAFESSGVEYLISAGTLLGAVRHGDIVPWDDDGDVVVINPAPDRLKSAFTYLREKGIVVIDSTYGSKLFWPDSPSAGGYEWNFPFVDLFYYDEGASSQGRPALMPLSEKVQVMWPEEFFHMEDVYPRRLYEVGSTRLYGPQSAVDFLDRMYPKWRTHGYKSYDHEREQYIEPPIQFPLKVESFPKKVADE